MRVAYQVPVDVELCPDAAPAAAIPRTFEDALVLENIELFRGLDSTDLLGRFKQAIANSKDVQALSTALCNAVDSGSKAGFALDLLYREDLKSVRLPIYITEGLEWLQEKLLLRQQELVFDPKTTQSASAEGK